MMDTLDLPAARGARGTVRLPGSKSISNRILLLAGAGRATPRSRRPARLRRHPRHARRPARLGVTGTRREGSDDYRVLGVGGAFPVKARHLFLGNAGTAFRPLTAALALAGGDYSLSGVPRMHERPIGDLVDALRQLGAQSTTWATRATRRCACRRRRCDLGPRSRARRRLQPVPHRAAAGAAAAGREVTIEVDGELISKPYVEITLNLLARFGIEVRRDGWQRFTIPAAAPTAAAGQIQVEGDASSASYFLAAGRHRPRRRCASKGVGRDSIQGDMRFVEAGQRWAPSGCARPNWIECRLGCAGRCSAIDLDCNHIPDAAMTLAVMALFADGTSTLRNIASWRVKETDRIAAMATELRKLGATVEEGADFIRVTPPAQAHG
jgi:3-phosphoshikimate 1-carboxyvinyltransferase